jgi:2-iminobutanoate/2-iminopropanoate deaminase
MKTVVQSDKAPKAIGPYSVANVYKGFVFTAGQLGIDPESGDLVAGGIINETRQSLTNIKYVLESAGASLEGVVKTTVFLKDMGDFAKMNTVYAEFFKENYPARSTVQVAALPKGGSVEIEVIALVD